jgi:hypothetical protein
MINKMYIEKQNKSDMSQKPARFFRKVIFASTMMILIALSVNAQSGRKIEGQIDAYMTAVKVKSAKPDVNELLSSDKNHTTILEDLAKYYSDTLVDVRLEAYKLTYTVGIKNADVRIRQIVVERITNGLSDLSGSLVNWSARHLSVFNRVDFNDMAKNNIKNAIGTEISRLEELIKVAGYINLTEAGSAIQKYAMYSAKTGVKWASYIALARMGDMEYVNKVVNAVRKQGLNDNVVYELVPDLVYTRQKACIDLAVEFLFEDKKLCTSSNADNPQKMECGYRIMEYLAPVIKDFPFGVKTSGDIDTKDYPAALKTVREWFLSKGSTYEIIDVSF